MKKRNRLLAILLTAIMTFSMLPSEAFATEAIDTGETAAAAVEETITSVGEEQDVEATTEYEAPAVEEAEETVAEEAAAEETAEPVSDQDDEVAAEEAGEPAETEEEIEEPVAEVEVETVTEEVAKTVEWPVTLEKSGSDYTVTATFDEAAGFPADVKMSVSEIRKSSGAYQDYYDQTLETIQNETDKEVELTEARFFDITFYTEDGELEPTGPVNVSIKYRDAIEAESSDDVHVLHFDDNNGAPQIMDIETDGKGDMIDEVSFETGSFSIYAVVGTTEPIAESRMTINFYNLKNSSEPIATVYVKNSDTAEEIDQIINDPGAGSLSQGQLFKGWIEKEGYTVDDVDDKMTIADIRTMAKDKASAGSITENETHDFYAMVFNTFSVAFKDEDDVTMHSEALISDGSSVDYTILQTYTPKDQDEVFLGWYADPEGNVSPKDSTAEYPYPYNTEVTISGNVVFKVYAPKGHWLNFEGNGRGSSYTPPQFITDTGVTTEPSAPLRNGYTFDGWYTGAPAEEGEDPTGSRFTFGQTISDNTTVYAKWNTASSAKYSVIIWKQRSTDDKNATDDAKTYDVAEVIPLSGTPGDSASSVVTQPNNTTNVNTGRGGSVRNYRVNGVEKGYTGFHAGRYDQNVTIAAEGTTVLNVYYDRNLITINFDAGYGSYIHNDDTGNYARRVAYTGLYDSELSFVWPTRYWTNSSGTGTGNNTLWSTSTTTLTFIGAFILPTPTNVSISLTRTNAGSAEYRFIRQKPDGTWPEITETDYVLVINAGTGNFTVTNKYAGFTVSQYKTGAYTTEDQGWTNTAPDESVPVTNSGINIRFTRDKNKITYLDGTYFNGDGAILQEATEEPLGESEDIYYAASIETYNKGGDDYYVPAAKDQYVFAGWYIDPTCSTEQPYEFTTMPAGGLTVYAKWVEKQYRVFLHPNVPSDDATFSMGNQATSFRADYDDKIAGGNPIQTQRDSYDLIGWYSDEACTESFNFAAYKLNDSTVKTPYDTTDDGEYNPTDETELDKYGNVIPGSEGVNKDADNQRVWILYKLDLYAKWRSTIDGAKGINLEYDPGDGTNAPRDDLFYLDNSEATAGAASTPTDTTKQFKHWAVQKWDGNDYVNSGVIVYPGDVFTVLKADSKALVTEWVNPNNEDDVITVTNPDPGTTPPDATHTKIKTASYTVQLKAVYGDAEVPTPTHITWYANNGTGYTETATDLQINQEADIVKPGTNFVYEGYDFLGWAREEEVSDAEGNVKTIGGADPDNLALELDEDDLFLEWDADNEKFIATANTGSGYTAGEEVKQIAADEKSPYHGMVAVWKRAKFFIYHSATGEVEDVVLPDEGDTIDLTTYVTSDEQHGNYLYGGYYHYDEVDGQRTKGDAYTANGKELVPTANTYYYLKEVDERHLRPKLYLISNKLHDNLIQGLYGIVSIDENAYSDVGLIIDGERIPVELAEEGIVVTKEGEEEPVETLTGGSLFDIDGCVIGMADLTNMIAGGARIDIKGYYKTPDSVVVTGNKDRRIQFPAGDDNYGGMPLFKGWGSGADQTRTGLVKSTSETTYEGGSDGKRMGAARMLKISAPSDKIEYRVTKIYDSGTEEQMVEGGNNTGNITYAPKSGYMFAGWYQDADYTVPADFADVTDDMTVYAKYISNKDVTLAFKRTGKKNNVNTFTVTVTVKNEVQLENVSVTVVEGNTAVLANRTVKKSGSGTKVKYTTEYKGTIDVVGLSLVDKFTSFVSWTTPDGTDIIGANKKCTYQLGNVIVR